MAFMACVRGFACMEDLMLGWVHYGRRFGLEFEVLSGWFLACRRRYVGHGCGLGMGGVLYCFCGEGWWFPCLG